MRSIAASLLFSSAAAFAAAQPPSLPRSAPEALGIPSSAILAFVGITEQTSPC